MTHRGVIIRYAHRNRGELLNHLRKAILINTAILVACMDYQLGIWSLRHTSNVREVKPVLAKFISG